MQLQHATALITGGASGLGEATVRRFAAQGANVVIIDLNAERGQALAQELGESARYVRADVSREEDMQTAVQTAVETFGALNILVSCAGVARALEDCWQRRPASPGSV